MQSLEHQAGKYAPDGFLSPAAILSEDRYGQFLSDRPAARELERRHRRAAAPA